MTIAILQISFGKFQNATTIYLGEFQVPFVIAAHCIPRHCHQHNLSSHSILSFPKKLPGLYFDHGFDVAPIHNVSSQIVADGPGAIVQHGLGSKLALLHIPETEPRVEGTLVVEARASTLARNPNC